MKYKITTATGQPILLSANRTDMRKQAVRFVLDGAAIKIYLTDDDGVTVRYSSVDMKAVNKVVWRVWRARMHPVRGVSSNTIPKK